MAADDREPLASEIMVPSTDPEKKEEKKVNGETKGKGKEDSDVPDIVSFLAIIAPSRLDERRRITCWQEGELS